MSTEQTDWQISDNGDPVRILGARVRAIEGDSLLLEDADGQFYAWQPAAAGTEPTAPAFDLLAHLQRQREWSERTFGPGERTAGVVDHIRKELREIEADPADLREWIDVVILALDGAWRAGHSPADIIAALAAKQAKNEARTWPDWRTAEPGKAIEHVRVLEPTAPAAEPQTYYLPESRDIQRLIDEL